MEAKAKINDEAAQLDELTYEPLCEPELDPALGLILESLRRRQPARTIQ
jgi:wyosine [tRNA(Phe)-imidazoG37] synthetase (radical SAM superfamily)